MYTRRHSYVWHHYGDDRASPRRRVPGLKTTVRAKGSSPESTATCPWPRWAFKLENIGCSFIWRGLLAQVYSISKCIPLRLSIQIWGRNWLGVQLRTDRTTTFSHVEGHLTWRRILSPRCIHHILRMNKWISGFEPRYANSGHVLSCTATLGPKHWTDDGDDILVYSYRRQ